MVGALAASAPAMLSAITASRIRQMNGVRPAFSAAAR